MTGRDPAAGRSGTAEVTPLGADDMDEVRDIIDMARQVGGYVPTSLRIMARKPAVLRAFAGLRDAVMRAPGEVPLPLRWLAAHAVSTSAGCRYCQAHTAANGAKAGLAPEKVEQLLRYETSSHLDPAERAIVAIGLAAGQTPNATDESHFAALREHFSEEGIVEIVAVIALFGWLNRWNDTFASDLEDAPRAFAEAHLAARGWSVGKHGDKGRPPD
ncbi:MAG: carboxymuconolactone decarboxylase family protein [Ectothiorhodospiraceae bacterium]|nr:carboxymuconolactone decarboxylase family protein [Ectothiorhodospiraceae bacterium]